MIVQIKPTEKQYLAWQYWLDPFTHFIFFGGGAGGGKSWHLCEKRLYEAYAYPGIRSFIGRKELKRLMQSTFITWTKVGAFHKIPKDDWWLDGKYNVIHFKNGSTIDLWTSTSSPPIRNISASVRSNTRMATSRKRERYSSKRSMS